MFLAGFLTVPLTGQRLLQTLLFARFQIETVALHFLDDVLGLDFALEAAQGILQRLALLHSHFCHAEYTCLPIQSDELLVFQGWAGYVKQTRMDAAFQGNRAAAAPTTCRAGICCRKATTRRFLRFQSGATLMVAWTGSSFAGSMLPTGVSERTTPVW